MLARYWGMIVSYFAYVKFVECNLILILATEYFILIYVCSTCCYCVRFYTSSSVIDKKLQVCYYFKIFHNCFLDFVTKFCCFRYEDDEIQYFLSVAWMLDPRYRSSPPLPGWPSVDDVKARLIQSAVAANTECAEEPSEEKNLSRQSSQDSFSGRSLLLCFFSLTKGRNRYHFSSQHM